MNESLQDRFEMAWREAVTLGERLRSDRLAARMNRYVNYGGNCKQTFF